MAFASVVGSGTSAQSTSVSTPHVVNLPTGITVGDRLIVGICGGSTLTSWTFPTGWSEFLDSNGYGAAYRDADGTEGTTISVTPNGVATSTSWSARIQGHDPATPPDAATPTVSATTGTPNPPSLTPTYGAADTLWLAIVRWASSSTALSASPTNYTTEINNTVSTSIRSAVASRALNAATEDPGTFTIAASNATVAGTLAVAGAVANPPRGRGTVLQAVQRAATR